MDKLTKSQIACLAVKNWEQESVGQGHRSDIETGSTVDTSETLSKRFKVSRGYIVKARQLMKQNPERFELVASGVEHLLGPKMPKVYIFKAEGTNFYKIGKTETSITNRLAACQTGSPFKLVIQCVIETVHHDYLESVLHRQFSSKRLEGEWFELSQEDLDSIQVQI